jgi:hypothetical protein
MQSSLLFIAIAILYIIAKIVLEKRLAPLDARTQERQLSDLAYSRGCSTYDLFAEAGSYWNFSKGKIESDFKNYLSEGFIPRYVSDLVTLHSSTGDQTYQKVLYSGGRPPYL